MQPFPAEFARNANSNSKEYDTVFIERLGPHRYKWKLHDFASLRQLQKEVLGEWDNKFPVKGECPSIRAARCR